MNPYLRVIDALNRADVKYVVVGGFAAVLHGSNRFTADLDLVVNLDRDHARHVIATMQSLGYQSRLPVDPKQFADQSTRDTWIRDKQMMVFSMFDPNSPALTVDLFVDPPSPFEELFQNSVLICASGVSARVCSIPDLIRIKSSAGRPVDLLDVQQLRMIQQGIRPPGIA